MTPHSVFITGAYNSIWKRNPADFWELPAMCSFYCLCSPLNLKCHIISLKVVLTNLLSRFSLQFSNYTLPSTLINSANIIRVDFRNLLRLWATIINHQLINLSRTSSLDPSRPFSPSVFLLSAAFLPRHQCRSSLTAALQRAKATLSSSSYVQCCPFYASEWLSWVSWRRRKLWTPLGLQERSAMPIVHVHTFD